MTISPRFVSTPSNAMRVSMVCQCIVHTVQVHCDPIVTAERAPLPLDRVKDFVQEQTVVILLHISMDDINKFD